MPQTNRKYVRGKAGESTRKMQTGRMAIVLAILLLMWLAIFVYSRNVKTVMSFGLIGTRLTTAEAGRIFNRLQTKHGNTATD